MRYARQAAGEALIGGRKSVEVVQAYILLALYPVPCRRWEDDRSWVYLGLAIRFAKSHQNHHYHFFFLSTRTNSIYTIYLASPPI